MGWIHYTWCSILIVDKKWLAVTASHFLSTIKCVLARQLTIFSQQSRLPWPVGACGCRPWCMLGPVSTGGYCSLQHGGLTQERLITRIDPMLCQEGTIHVHQVDLAWDYIPQLVLDLAVIVAGKWQCFRFICYRLWENWLTKACLYIYTSVNCVSIDSVNDLVTKKWQAVIWTNEYQVPWSHKSWPGLNYSKDGYQFTLGLYIFPPAISLH